jgi:NADH:ubiquinone oxidoreductase subunit F (NADH-binding)
MSKNIIAKLKKENLLGRGGAEFPTGLKWEMVKKAKAKKKYVICNASEGEPGVFKDGFILENYPEKIVQGIEIAMETIGNKNISAYIYLRKDYYQRFGKKLKKIIEDLPISFFKKPDGYFAGEETSLLNAIEGKILEPREKPPFPTEKGLFDYPTLINNVETFYCVAKIDENKYKKTRFYSISENNSKDKNVYELPIDWTIEKILKETKNFPKFDFFVQIGGGASGKILSSSELNQKVGGSGAIVIYDFEKTDPFELMKKWADFFFIGNCNKCVPCREGIYRIREMIEKKKIDEKILKDLFFVLKETSFCPLGKTAVVPFESLIKKIF